MIYIDKQGEIILSNDFNLNDDENEILTEKIEREILNKVKQLSNIKNSESIKGITEINNTPAILVAEPITTTDGSKASGGLIISGRYLDEMQISRISSSVMVDLSMEKYNKKLKLKSDLKWYSNAAIKNVNKRSAVGYKILADIEGNPYLVIKINVNRDIYRQATKSIIYFVIIIILISFSLFGIVLIYLNKVVAKRLIKMNSIVHNISRTKDLTIKMKTSGNDEIASLAEGFNNMLEDLSNYSHKIELGQNKYYSLISNMVSCFAYNEIVFSEEGIPIDFVILDGNNAFFEIMEQQREKVIGRKISDFMGDDKINIKIFTDIADVAMYGGKKKIDEVYFENAKKWFAASVYSFEEGYFALMFNEITGKKKIEQENLELANIDTLTGLANRKKIMETINTTIVNRKNNGRRFALLFIDLDDFKKVNDSLGHDVGDILIQKVGARFKNVIASEDVVGRIGGDEFIILQDNISSSGDAEKLALRIRNVLKESFIYMESEIYTSASIGVSIYPDDGMNTSSLMKNLDIAMYEAKNSGGSCYRLYSGHMNKAGLTNLILESRLYKALEKDEITPPANFIPMAENNGYIIELGAWVLREACMQCSKWRDTGLEIYVTVNITFKQLEQRDFVDIVSNALKETNLNPKHLVLEITENTTMQNVDLTIKTLNKIKALGVSIALDDFGTGYSSLSYVNRLPVDILKIDRSLIINITEGTQNIAIVKVIIAMAQSLNIKVVVEGVEDMEQFTILRELNSYAIQGYLISKPIPANDIQNLMERKINLE
ncbi:MAG: diguanylate cyclase (GGDEF)-like protein [Clostridium sp.]|jgi:diguanylate cyclase (GGDEF)-like protein